MPDTEVERTLREIDQTRTERNTLRIEVEGLRARAEASERMVQEAIREIKESRAERDYYMRECAELRAQLNTIAAVASEATAQSKRAPYRPNGSASHVNNPNLNGGGDKQADTPDVAELKLFRKEYEDSLKGVSHS